MEEFQVGLISGGGGLPINGEEPAGWDRTFQDFGDQKIQVSRDFKMGRFVLH